MPRIEELLSSPQVRVRDVDLVVAKLQKFIAGGASKLMVISDFDFTISRYADEKGKRCSSCYCIFDDAVGKLYPDFYDKFIGLWKKYGPIEHDHHMTIEEKIPHMEEWWNSSHECIISAGFNRNQIEKFVGVSNIQLRDEADVLMNVLTAHEVPFIVFSAGIGTIIEMYLRLKFGKVADNTHIVSNMMLFDENDRVNAFSEPLIHVFCKNSSVIPKDASFSGQLSDRTNVILMGDSVGDAFMDVGVEQEQASLKIGFVNHDSDVLVDKYLNYFDIVLVEDQTMSVPNQILNAIVAQK
ncbi:unnamed protein product [Caenorhabditis auriculariae]|uniref:5'-nucleotidase n=1 Tax=Caenorhabditis auriculariae TaxID=2777116 RepID=A0A8S1H6K0_9PELO|nr:unnamed protein product [Caenorhabditis auriculariae]